MRNSITNNIKLIALASAMVVGAATADAADLRLKRSTDGKVKIQKSASQKGFSGATSAGFGSADLVILPRYTGNSGLPQSGYCGPWNGGNQKIFFYVKNIGGSVALSSDTAISFNDGSSSTIILPPLVPNQSVLRSKTIPSEAWGPSQYHSSVQFSITADHNNDAGDTNSSNNQSESLCNGPAT